MRKILAVAVKETRQIRRDAISLLLLLGLPTFFLVLYGFALNFDVRHVALAVQDDDRSSASRELVSSFVNSTYFDRVASPPAGTDLEHLAETRVARAILVIPQGFGKRLAAGRRAPVQLLLDGADAITATTVQGYASAITANANLEALRQAVVTLGQPDQVTGIDYRPRVWYNPELKSTQFLVPGLIGTLLMLTAALSTALSVVREKERGTMEQLRLAPVRTWQLILGKTLPYLVMSFAATVTILVAARILFGVEVRGSYGDLFLATLVYLIGGLGFGLLISTLASSQAAAFQLTLLTSNLPAIMLSGYIFQIRTMPEPLQWITYAVPARYFLVILRGVILKGAPLAPFWRELVALAVFNLVVLGLAALRMARRGLGVYTLFRVIVKEFLQLRQDRASLPLIFVAPVVQLVIFGFAVNTDVTHVPLLLVDQDRTAASRELAQRFVAGDYFELVGVEYEANALDAWLVSGRAQVALVIGGGFAEKLASGRAPKVQLIADGSDASSTTVALGYADGIIGEASRGLLRERLAAALAAAARRGGLEPRAPGQVEMVTRVWYNPDLQSRLFYVPAVLAMILMTMTMLLSAMGVVREKEIGTMEQISVTPIRPWQLMIGKLFPSAVIGLIQMLLVTAIAVWGFGVPLRGSFLLLLVLTQLFLLNTLGLGLLVSTVVRTQQQAMMLTAFGLMVPMIYLSGLIFPIENMPQLIQYFTYAVPARYYAVILRGIFLKGSGLSELWPQALALTGMGLALLTLAVSRFKKSLD